MSAQQPSWQLHHVAVVVQNMDKAIQHYTSLGLCPAGSFRTFQSTFPATYRGRQVTVNLKGAMARMGEARLELFEAIPGDNPYWDFLQKKGEGMHHLAFTVPDLKTELDRTAQQGIGVLMRGQAGRVDFAYLDTAGTGGAYVELMQIAPG